MMECNNNVNKFSFYQSLKGQLCVRKDNFKSSNVP